MKTLEFGSARLSVRYKRDLLPKVVTFVLATVSNRSTLPSFIFYSRDVCQKIVQRNVQTSFESIVSENSGHLSHPENTRILLLETS